MKKWNFIVDVALCENCNNCLMTNKDEYVDNSFAGYSAPQPRHGQRWIRIETKERGSGSLFDVAYLVSFCNQCDNAPCLRAADNGAISKRDDGIVIIDPIKAKGQKQLVAACPYGHIWWNDELGLPQKWSWDAHLLDSGWTSPRSEQVCPTGCLRAVKCSDEEMSALAGAERLETLKPELGTKPRAWYKNLYRFNREFIAGSVCRTQNEVEDCVSAAQVVLKKGKQEIARLSTDYFGDFKFDGLEADSGEYELAITDASGTVIVNHTLKNSVYLGPISMGAL